MAQHEEIVDFDINISQSFQWLVPKKKKQHETSTCFNVDASSRSPR